MQNLFFFFFSFLLSQSKIHFTADNCVQVEQKIWTSCARVGFFCQTRRFRRTTKPNQVVFGLLWPTFVWVTLMQNPTICVTSSEVPLVLCRTELLAKLCFDAKFPFLTNVLVAADSQISVKASEWTIVEGGILFSGVKSSCKQSRFRREMFQQRNGTGTSCVSGLRAEPGQPFCASSHTNAQLLPNERYAWTRILLFTLWMSPYIPGQVVCCS